MRWRPKFRFSIAQLLLVTLVVAAFLGCFIGLRKIWSYRFGAMVRDVQISADGTKVGFAFVEDKPRSASYQFYCAICDAETGEFLRRTSPTDGEPAWLVLSSDMSTWVELSPDGRLEFGRLDSDKRWVAQSVVGDFKIVALQERRSPRPIAIDRNGTICAACCGNRIAIWDVETGQLQQVITATGTVMDLSIAADGRRIAGSIYGPTPTQGSRRVEVWRTIDGQSEGLCRVDQDDDAPDVTWINSSTFVTSEGVFRNPVLGKVGLNRVMVESRNGRLVKPIAVSPDGTAIATAFPTIFVATDTMIRSDYPGSVNVYEPTLQELRYPSVRTNDDVGLLAISDGGAKVVTGCGFDMYRKSRLFRIRLIDMKTGLTKEIVPHPNTRRQTATIIASTTLVVGFAIWMLIRTWRARKPDADAPTDAPTDGPSIGS